MPLRPINEKRNLDGQFPLKGLTLRLHIRKNIETFCPPIILAELGKKQSQTKSIKHFPSHSLFLPCHWEDNIYICVVFSTRDPHFRFIPGRHCSNKNKQQNVVGGEGGGLGMMPANIQSTGLVISWWITVFTEGLSPWGASQITNMQPHITARAEQPTSKLFKVLAEKIPHAVRGREQPTFQISEGKAVPGMKPASSLKVHPHCKVGHMPCSALEKTWMLFRCLHLNNFIPSVPKLKPLVFRIVFQLVYKAHVIIHLYFNPISPQFPSAIYLCQPQPTILQPKTVQTWEGETRKMKANVSDIAHLYKNDS